MHQVDVATPRGHAALFLHMLPMFLLVASFVGGGQIATDTTAGERERGSLEPLLLTPAVRRSMVAGKWLAAAVFSAVASLLTTAYTLAALGLVRAERIGLSLSLSAVEIAWVLAAALPLSLFFPAAQVLVSSFARTVREAQTYLSLSILLPMLPTLLVTLAVFDVASWMTAVPVLGQGVLLAAIVRGEATDPMAYVLAAVSALACALVCIELTAWLFRRERIIYGR